MDFHQTLPADAHCERPEQAVNGHTDSVPRPVRRIVLPPSVSLYSLGELKEQLLDVLGQGCDAILDLTETSELDTAFIQLVCAAHRAFQSAGTSLRLEPTDNALLALRLALLGFTPATAAQCGCITCPLLTQEAL